MPTWCPVTPYKGLFLLFILFVLLEYFFNSISYSKSPFFDTSKAPPHSKEFHSYGPLLKTLLFKNNKTNNYNISSTTAIISTGNKTSNNSYSFHNTTEAQLLPNSSSMASWDAGNSVNISKADATVTPLCPDDVSSNLLGRVPVITSPVPTVRQLEQNFYWLKPGGHWSPETCRVTKKVALVIPFRCRGEHLLLFLQHMHPFLRRQMLDYTIFIVEQEGEGAFNRAMLMNVGYVEALKSQGFDCFIFHDIDLLPEDDRNLYTCPEQPRHMSVAVDLFKYRLPYTEIFGGVSAITREQFQTLNGFSNAFWGWGGEDDDMSNRIRYHHLFISRYPLTIARYKMLTHKKDKPSPNRFDMLKQGQKRFDKDGLSNLRYRLVHKKENMLYTWLLVDIRPPS